MCVILLCHKRVHFNIMSTPKIFKKRYILTSSKLFMRVQNFSTISMAFVIVKLSNCRHSDILAVCEMYFSFWFAIGFFSVHIIFPMIRNIIRQKMISKHLILWICFVLYFLRNNVNALFYLTNFSLFNEIVVHFLL